MYYESLSNYQKHDTDPDKSESHTAKATIATGCIESDHVIDGGHGDVYSKTCCSAQAGTEIPMIGSLNLTQCRPQYYDEWSNSSNLFWDHKVKKKFNTTPRSWQVALRGCKNSLWEISKKTKKNMCISTLPSTSIEPPQNGWFVYGFFLFGHYVSRGWAGHPHPSVPRLTVPSGERHGRAWEGVRVTCLEPRDQVELQLLWCCKMERKRSPESGMIHDRISMNGWSILKLPAS